MNKLQVEARVHELVDHVVVARGKIEDEYVEAKGTWPGPDKAAQLAGMANKAAGHPIIWIVGLSEDEHKVLALDDTDPAQWWPRMEKAFAYEVTPELTPLKVYTEHGPVMCLHFKTDGAPYMVKTPNSGWSEAAVPWREGTRTRSARRGELLSLLVQSVNIPVLELVAAKIMLGTVGAARPGETAPPALYIHGRLFIESEAGAHLVFPRHRRSASVRLSSGEVFDADLSYAPVNQQAAEWRQLEARMRTDGGAYMAFTPGVDPFGISSTRAGLVVRGPDLVTFRGGIHGGISKGDAAVIAKSDWVEVRIRMQVGGASKRAASISRRLRARSRDGEDTAPAWLLNAADDSLPSV
ncbi:hypothetical protein [Nocardia brasiliensis]|uniref:hypothetical protein n=1 Tax=Nocardia brasiliensis TaxID=37326 RepID=UPI00245711DD|nr:hypothetical protein [Nocardia brasiliensis]